MQFELIKGKKRLRVVYTFLYCNSENSGFFVQSSAGVQIPPSTGSEQPPWEFGDEVDLLSREWGSAIPEPWGTPTAVVCI